MTFENFNIFELTLIFNSLITRILPLTRLSRLFSTVSSRSLDESSTLPRRRVDRKGGAGDSSVSSDRSLIFLFLNLKHIIDQ